MIIRLVATANKPAKLAFKKMKWKKEEINFPLPSNYIQHIPICNKYPFLL